jgi:Ca2+-binding RTX toxin-like protein
MRERRRSKAGVAAAVGLRAQTHLPSPPHAVGNLASAAFAVGTSAHDADDRIIYDPASGFLFFDQDGAGTGFAPVHFATVAPGTNLTPGDFIVN